MAGTRLRAVVALRPRIQRALCAGRSLLNVRLPGSSAFSYTLPSLHEPEREWLHGLEARLRATRYDAGSCVPVYWDTESTGLGSVLWWTPQRHRVVQIAATAAGAEFKIDINPYPVAMSGGAAETTGMSTAAVWAHTVPPQVRSRPHDALLVLGGGGGVGLLCYAVVSAHVI